MAPEITIRELRPSDRRALAFTFGRLSARSRYQRYFTLKPVLSARELARLANVDHWHHEAVIAFSPSPRTLGATTRPAALLAAGNVLELSYSLSVASSGLTGASGAASSPPSPSPPSAPTATG